jgi:hypothetical protein
MPVLASLMRNNTSLLAVSALCAMVFSAYFFTRSLWLGLGQATDMPLADQWAVVADYIRVHDGDYQFLDLFNLHNEHRTFTTRPILFVDAYLFSMRGLFPIVAAYAALAAIAAGIVALSLEAERSASSLMIGVSISLGLAWSMAQGANLSWAIQVCFPLVHLFVLLSYAALAKALSPGAAGPYGWLTISIIADFLATFSLGSGFLTIIPAIAIAVWLRCIDRRVTILAVMHALFTAAYFRHYPLPSLDNYGTTTLLTYIDLIARFLAISLNVQNLAAMGYLILIVFVAFLSWATWRAIEKRTIRPEAAILLALAFFVFLEAILTAYARAKGLAPRYTTPSVIFIMVLLGLGWRASTNAFNRIAVIALLCLSIAATNTAYLEQAWINQIHLVRDSRNSILAGERRPDYMHVIFPGMPAAFVEVILNRIKELGLGPYR